MSKVFANEHLTFPPFNFGVCQTNMHVPYLYLYPSLTSCLIIIISLNLVPNAQVCVYLIIHITKLQLQTTFPKPLYIPHSTCIRQDPGSLKS
jgi:hypothetical protein